MIVGNSGAPIQTTGEFTMRSITRRLLAIGFFLVPFGVAEKTPGDEARAVVEELSDASEMHSQMLKPSLTQTAQATSTIAGSAETTVSVKSLLDAKVLDSTNREIGTLRSLLADPQTGKLVRADIALKGSGLMGKGGDQQLSVPWEQLSVKRQEGNFVLVLNQEAMQKLQSIEKQDSSGKQDRQGQQKK
jgi:sporulation protein YlmC with PRC-barrel domain